MTGKGRTLLRLVVAFVLILVIAGLTKADQRQARGKFEPPHGKTMVLIGCDWSDNFKSYTRLTGDTPAGGVFWYEFNGDTTFFWHNAKENVGENGVLHVNFNLVSNTGGSLKPYLEGKKDPEIKKIGEAFKIWGHPLLVTIGTECDHPGNNGYTPQQFVAVYRKIRRMWEGLGVTNVAYVVHFIGNAGNPRWASYYPGDDAVDWVAFSFYWFEKDVPHVSEISRLAHKHRKPVMIAESGPLNGKARSFSDWHGPFLKYASALGVKVICYNNWREPPVDRAFHNTAFDRLPKPIADAWGRAMKSPAYLHASPDLQEILEGRKKAVTEEPPKPEVVQPAGGKIINLLQKIDPKRDVIEGDWKYTGKVLTFAGDKEWSRIQVPYKTPEEYDLTVVAERIRGTEILIIGLVVDGHQATVVLDGWGGGVSGLERIDGKVSQDNETTRRGWRFTNGKPTTIVCKVRKGVVSVTCDGEEIVEWKGDARRLSIVGGWKVPDENQLFLGGWKGGAFRFRKLEVREVAVSDGEQGH